MQTHETSMLGENVADAACVGASTAHHLFDGNGDLSPSTIGTYISRTKQIGQRKNNCYDE